MEAYDVIANQPVVIDNVSTQTLNNILLIDTDLAPLKRLQSVTCLSETEWMS